MNIRGGNGAGRGFDLKINGSGAEDSLDVAGTSFCMGGVPRFPSRICRAEAAILELFRSQAVQLFVGFH